MVNDQDGTTPPRGWELPREQPERADAGSFAQLVEELLALVPDELRVRLTEAMRQLLEAIRALIDWCVARLQQSAAEPVEVHDIPIL
ncbi:MAG TPA: hypothetical protein VG293_07835 [Solirubrobacteraceae bacterium]|nr:hypothetical protein [Solirubrobacteraceae bacterium]